MTTPAPGRMTGRLRRGVSVLTVALATLAASIATLGIGAQPAAAAGTLYGVDVSHYQGTINWSSVKSSGQSVRVHQGDPGHHVPRPELQRQLHQRVLRRHDPRRVPLRHPELVDRRGTGRLLRQPRWRLVGGQPDAARSARHRVRTVRFDLLGPVPVQHGELDPLVHQRVPRPHHPVGGHLHDHQLVVHLHRQLVRVRRQQPAVHRALQHQRRYVAGRLVGFYTFWQYTSTGSVPGISGNVDRDRFNGASDRLLALANNTA